MSLKNTVTTYGSVTKFLHWLIFFLLLFMVTLGYFLDSISKESQPLAYNIHKLTGLTILVLMILRAIWAYTNPKPRLPFGTLPWQRTAEHVVQILLYLVVLAMPIVGWIGSVASGRPPLVGDVSLTLPIALSKVLAKTMFEIHSLLAIVLIVLVSIHVLAVLYHCFIKRDNVLRRMMPGRTN